MDELDINALTPTTILDEKVFYTIFDEEDEITRARLVLTLEDKAKAYNVKSKFESLLKVYKQQYKSLIKAKQKEAVKASLENWTNFSDCPYDQMKCANWFADDTGVSIFSNNIDGQNIVACQHPILPVERMQNLETGEEQIKLAFKRNGKWKEIITKKRTVAAASKIVNLADLGVAVTSENAKYLVKFLNEVECQNESDIEVKYSSTKVGWIGKYFLPYDKEILFDGEQQFRQLYQSIHPSGSREKWYEHVKQIRASGRIEPKMLLAASFASVLVKPLGILPFWIHLWGDTEGGKTVTEMVAASVWANPAESKYIGDFQTTEVAFEARANILNSLPMIMDDTAKVATQWKNGLASLIYSFCSGKGKSRSNKELGTRQENYWGSCLISSGEAPIVNIDDEGGAINRVLEIQAPRKIFDDPQLTADTVKFNYGWAGMDFIQIIKGMDVDALKAEQRSIQAMMEDDATMQKQAISLSVILLADKLITEHLFKDGNGIDMEESRQVLKSKDFVDKNQRCYEYLCDKIRMNPNHFVGEAKEADVNLEQWGIFRLNERKGVVQAIIIGTAFEELCKAGGFSSSAFLSWADRQGLIETGSGRGFKKVWKNRGAPIRAVFLTLHALEEKDAKGRTMFE